MANGTKAEPEEHDETPDGDSLTGTRGASLLDNVLDDIELMYGHAGQCGKTLPDGLARRISDVMANAAPGRARRRAGKGSSHAELTEAMDVHNELLEVIVPATADTIRSSELKNNNVMKLIAGSGAIGLVLIGVANFQEKPDPNLLKISGALLGAALYAFWTARSFLRENTFSRRFTQDYVIRFGLGVVSGFILGSILADNSFSATAPGLEQFGPFTLAVVGAYSAEAVVQILQRIAEILVTAVRGSDYEQLKSAANKTASQKLNKAAAELRDALQGASAEEVAARVEGIAKNLLKE